jgi:hypothetical protein
MYQTNGIMTQIPIEDYKNEVEYQKLTLKKKGKKYMYVCAKEYTAMIVALCKKLREQNNQPIL